MADEVHYATGPDYNKRKYEEATTPPPPRRPTGFSAPIVSTSPNSAAPYGGAAPPIDGIELAKQRAQEIAARLVNSAEAKRPRVENGGGFDSNAYVSDQKLHSSNVSVGSGSSIPVSYGYPTNRKIEIPNGRVGVIIGKGGETIKYLQVQSGAKIQITKDADHDPNLPTRMVELMGTADQIAKAEQLINEVIAEADAGGSGIVARRITGQAGSEQFVMRIPNNRVGLVIGKGGETIKSIQARTGARVQVIPLHLPPGDSSPERTVQIDGSNEQIEAAKQMVNEILENRNRNPATAGGYPQQGYQARPPTSWSTQPPQMQQPGYYTQQPGAYPGQQPQYNQPPYSGYPPQQASGGYPQNWDQSAAAPPNQHPPQGGGYDYYGQLPQAQSQHQQTAGGPPTDSSAYNYSQAPTSGGYGQQGYPQDAYGSGYHAPPNPNLGYHQQQGYGSTPGYGNAANSSSQDGHAGSYGAQGESSQSQQSMQPGSVAQQGYMGQQPSPSPGYPTPTPNQPGYGVPPTSQPGYGPPPSAQGGYASAYGPPSAQKTPTHPSAYAQPQQSPSQGGYAQPTSGQPGYPTAQPGYPPSDASAQRTPPAGYGGPAAQTGAYPPQYGAPPVTPPAYGQPPYYAGAYSQPAYATDGNTTPASQPSAAAAPPSGITKASPRS